jgi:MauM/NapG family ferredoxin protein
MLSELLKKLASLHAPLRPPGAVSEDQFLQMCIRCRKCAEVCPYDSIKMADGLTGINMGTPFIEPRKIPCYLCMKCPDVCPTGALEQLPKKEDVKMGTAQINPDTCLAYNHIVCRACYERCPIYREAIILKDEIYPEVIEDKCTGCGICENVCLTDPPSVIIMSAHQ